MLAEFREKQRLAQSKCSDEEGWLRGGSAQEGLGFLCLGFLFEEACSPVQSDPDVIQTSLVPTLSFSPPNYPDHLECLHHLDRE